MRLSGPKAEHPRDKTTRSGSERLSQSNGDWMGCLLQGDSREFGLLLLHG
jgi:hypothetical protein